MTLDKKLGLGFLVVCGMIVSGCLGYSIKDTQHKDRMEIVAQYNAQNSNCSRMMQQLSNMSGNRVYYVKKSPKEVAIERMQRN
jgi:hypothetical protein